MGAMRDLTKYVLTITTRRGIFLTFLLFFLLLVSSTFANEEGLVEEAGTNEADSLIASFDPRAHLRLDLGPVEAQLGGRFVLDATKYGNANRSRSGFKFNDVRLRLTLSAYDFIGHVEFDALGRKTPRNLYEAWAAWEPCAAFRLSAGQMRVGLGSEFASRERDLAFAGYSFASYLDGRYDVGLRIDGDLVEDVLFYEATATAGKGFGLDGHRRQSPLYAMKLVAHPFGFVDSESGGFPGFLRGLYGGAAIARLDDFDDPIILATPYETVVFKTPDLNARGGMWFHYEAGYHHGPFRLSGELVHGVAEDVPIGGGVREDMDQLSAYHVSFAWNLTGEEQLLRRGRWEGGKRSGRCALIPPGTIPGRLEASVRYSNTDMDRELFNRGITTYAASAQEIRTFSAFLSWSPPVQPKFGRLRVGAGIVRTISDSALTALNFRKRDTFGLLRIELDF